MKKTIRRFEHDRLKIGEEGFEKSHWDACVQLNTVHKTPYFAVEYNGIRFRQFVGVIEIKGITIEIHPKADRYEDDAKWRNVLLPMLFSCGHLTPDPVGDANLSRQKLNLLEIYFAYFLKEMEHIIRSGPVKQYRLEVGNMQSLKGKLDFAGNIRRNLVHKERFYTVHEVYDHDHLLHQVLSYALGIVEQYIGGSNLADRLKRVQFHFPVVSEKRICAQDLEKIRLNRKTRHYERALGLARLIIRSYSPDLKSGSRKMIALLFDMNKLWEHYILVHLRRYCRAHPEWSVSGQESALFHGNSRTIRPDIVLRRGDSIYIIDTKWKLPKNNQDSIEDLRQMYVYGRFWQAERMILLYPGKDDAGSYISYRNSTDIIKHACKSSIIEVIDAENHLKTNIGQVIIDLIQRN